jgi:putative ABC transport system permease protein
MRGISQDLRYALRALTKSPGFTSVSVLVLALGIGANTAIFSVVNAVLLQRLPYKYASRLVVVWEQNRTQTDKHNVVGPANFLDWVDQADCFDGLAAFYDTPMNLTGSGEPVEIPCQVSTGNLFDLLGADAELGRVYTADDEGQGRDDVIVLSHELWMRQFGGASDLIGKSLTLNGHPLTVIGVMPAGFRWFIKENSFMGKPPELWTPTKITNRTRGSRYLQVVGRLKPGVTTARAQQDMDRVASVLEQQYPAFNANWGVGVVPVREQLAGEIEPALRVLLLAVAFVLLIACANVANLMLSRATSRRKEIAVRLAIGAGRWRVLRQFLAESLILALAGGFSGLLLATFAIDALVALTPQNLIRREDVGLSAPVLCFTFGIALLTGLVFGTLPGLEAGRSNPQLVLQEAGRSNSPSSGSRRVRRMLVVAEVALAFVLLVGAGLMIQSFVLMRSINPGFDAENLLTMRVLLPRAKYPNDAARIAFFRRAVDGIAALPGVRSASAASAPPFAGLGAATGFTIVGQPAPEKKDAMLTDVRATDENYFRTMRIPLVSGRTFTPEEATENRHVVVINEALARGHLAGIDPIGQRLMIDMNNVKEPTEIIGVVGDASYARLEGERRPMVYWPNSQLPLSGMTIVVRTERDPLALGRAAQLEILGLDNDQPVADVRTMESYIAESIARYRFGTLVLEAFASLALILALVGIYSVIAYSVTQRTPEIGIRLALGARPQAILGMVVAQGLLLACVGIIVGLGAAFGLTRLMRSLLYNVSPTDPKIFVLITVLLGFASLLACYIPARKATRVDPMTALRYE